MIQLVTSSVGDGDQTRKKKGKDKKSQIVDSVMMTQDQAMSPYESIVR